MNTKIFIPSYGRADICAKYSGGMLIRAGLGKHTHVIVPKEQVREYQDALPGIHVQSIPPRYERNLVEKRQYILDELSGRYSFQVDDDLTFHTRVSQHKAVRAQPVDVYKMFTLLSRWLRLKEIGLVSVGQRYMFQHRPMDYHENSSCIHVLGIDKHVFSENDIRFNTLTTNEDYYVSLRVLLSGYSTRIADLYLHTELPMNYNKGGVSRYRTAIMQTQSTKMFQAMFKDFIRFRRDIYIPNFGVVPGVTIQWKKAYTYGQQHKEKKR